jgi:ribonuclease-3
MKSIFSHISGILNISLNRRVDLLKKKYRNEIIDLGLFDNETISELEDAIGLKIKAKGLYEQAMIHRSYLQMIDDDRQEISNERLEFLGDSILGMAVAEYLFFSNLQELEGNLTKTRAQIVNKKSLAYCSKKLKLENFLLLSFSAKRSLETGSESILADAMEALIAAVYLDNDFKTAKYFIYDNIISVVVDSEVYDDKNYKSILLEEVQSRGYSFPKYSVDKESGPDHDKTFVVSVFVEDRKIAIGSGKNKKEAEQQAAKNALNSKDLYN